MTIVALFTLARGARRRKTDRRTRCCPPGGLRTAPIASWRPSRARASRAGPTSSIDRALSALRIAAASLVGGTVSQSKTARKRRRRRRTDRLGRTGAAGCDHAWAPATADAVERCHRPGSAATSSRVCPKPRRRPAGTRLETLADALATFTAARYGSSAERDGTALDEALSAATARRAASCAPSASGRARRRTPRAAAAPGTTGMSTFARLFAFLRQSLADWQAAPDRRPPVLAPDRGAPRAGGARRTRARAADRPGDAAKRRDAARPGAAGGARLDAALARRGDRARAARPVSARPALLLPGAGRSVHRARQPRDVVSRPAHRHHDRRVDQHAHAVHGRHAEQAGSDRRHVLHDGGRRRALRAAAHEGQVPRPDRPDRVRQPGLRHHAVHQRLRQRAAEHLAHRRSAGVQPVPRSGHRDHAGDHADGRALQGVQLPGRRPATSWCSSATARTATIRSATGRSRTS